MTVTPKKPKRGEVWHCGGFEDKTSTDKRTIEGNRFVAVVSPDSLNSHSDTVIVVPMTTGGHLYAFRVSVQFKGKSGYVLCDQVFAVDRAALTNFSGALDSIAISKIQITLQNMFK